MIELGKNSVDCIRVEDIDTMEYHSIPENEEWRVNLVKEMIEVKENEYEVPGFTNEELEEIIDFVCTS